MVRLRVGVPVDSAGGVVRESLEVPPAPRGECLNDTTSTSVSVYSIRYKMKKAYQCSLKCGTLGGRRRCGYIVERELSTMSTHHDDPLDKERIIDDSMINS